MVPDHLIVYFSVWPGRQLPDLGALAGKQSAVDQIRVPSAAKTVKTCSVPETSRWQASVPVLVTTIPTIGWLPAANVGALVVAVTVMALSGQISLPSAS